MKIRYSNEAIKFLQKQPKKTVQRINAAIHKLTLSPSETNATLMKGYTDRRKRLRIGGFRVIFKNITENQIEILLIMDIGNRGDIYK